MRFPFLLELSFVKVCTFLYTCSHTEGNCAAWLECFHHFLSSNVYLNIELWAIFYCCIRSCVTVPKICWRNKFEKKAYLFCFINSHRWSRSVVRMKAVPFIILNTWPGITRLDIYYPGLMTAPLKRTSTWNECFPETCEVWRVKLERASHRGPEAVKIQWQRSKFFALYYCWVGGGSFCSFVFFPMYSCGFLRSLFIRSWYQTFFWCCLARKWDDML